MVNRKKELENLIIKTMAELSICDTSMDIVNKQNQLYTYTKELHSINLKNKEK